MTKAFPLLLGGLAFGLAYGQAPLYYSNQNQYFLQGLADAGGGYLDRDWLANTADPTPLFSILVAFTAGYLHPWLFHLYYLGLQLLYVAALAGIFSHLAGGRDTLKLRLAFLALLIGVHAALGRWASHRMLGLDYPWYLQSGVAGQYILGAMFQPSTFGVLLVVAIWQFGAGRPFLAALCACLAATVHSTYLLPAALFTLAFLFVLWREGKPKQAVMLGGWSLLLVLPVVAFVLLTFRPTSAETFEEAQHILVHFRIPHHCLPELWLDGIAFFQIGWILLALLLCRGTRLFPVLGIPLLLGAVLTLLQFVTGSDTLALLFPWRVSSVLVPAATAVLLARLVSAGARRLENGVAVWGAGVAIALPAFAGIALMYFRQGYQSTAEEVPMMDFVRLNKSPDDVYLIPVRLPNLKATTRGSLSSDFKPAAAKKADQRIIPVDLQRFRLYTQAPIFVDFKAIPYRDEEVLQWRRRLSEAEFFCDRLIKGKFAEVKADLHSRGITHIVLPMDHELEDPSLERVFADRAYRIYRIRR